MPDDGPETDAPDEPADGEPTDDEPADDGWTDDQPLSARARALVEAGADPDDPDSSDDLHEQVVALLRRGLASAEPDAPGLLAAAHLRVGDRHAAVEVLAPAVAVQGRLELAGVLGRTYAALGDHDAAERAFLLALDDGDLAATNDYGVFLRDRGRIQEAAHVLDRAARGGDELAALNLVALHLEELDDPVTATVLAERFVDDARPSTLVALADVRLAAGLDGEAEDLYRRAADGGGACANIYYGWFLEEQRDDAEGAERALRRGHDVGEEGAAYHLARFLYDAGRTDDARPLFEEAADAGDPDAAAVLEESYGGLVDRFDD